MNTQGIGLGLFALASLISACGGNAEPLPYRPLGDHEVFLQAFAYDDAYTSDGIDYYAELTGCISDPASGYECGFRKDLFEEYAPDTFIFESNGEKAQLTCYIFIYSNPVIQTANCEAPFKSLSAGQEISVSVNDVSGSTITMPELPRIKEPIEGAEVNLNASGGLKLSWEGQSAPGDALYWIVWTDIFSPAVCPKDIMPQRTAEVVVEDVGSLVIPPEAFPSNLPAEGCPVVIDVGRTRDGKFGAGIKGRGILGDSIARVAVTLKP